MASGLQASLRETIFGGLVWVGQLCYADDGSAEYFSYPVSWALDCFLCDRVGTHNFYVYKLNARFCKPCFEDYLLAKHLDLYLFF